MLAHSPPLPLTVDYGSNDAGITAEDEEGILLALEQRHRVRHLRLLFSARVLQKLVMGIDEEFPILEYLIVYHLTGSTVLVLPETLQAPHLRHLALGGFAFPSPLHPTAASLVTLYLVIYHQPAYFQPNVLLQWISIMNRLESLVIAFSFPVPNRDDVERQLTHAPITTHITLPSLRLFWFRGVSAYLDAVTCRITTPRLETLRIQLFNQLTFSVPHLPQFMNTAENLRFDIAAITFKDQNIYVLMFSEADTHVFGVAVDCWHFDWQISSVAQISNTLGQVFSAVENLTFGLEDHSQSSEEHNDVDRIEWRNLLRSFSNVKILRIEDGLVDELSRCLRLEDGELPLELLPELQKLECLGSRDPGNAFASFIDARQNAGRPVTLISHIPSPSPLLSELPRITSPSDGAGNDIET
jgi:hypothetical protein